MEELMKRYQVDNLVGISPEDFKWALNDRMELSDYEMEGYDSPEGQRVLSVDFHWGHNHDFGTFKLDGLMRNRHIEILQWYADHGMKVEGKRVLDVGAWTGGMSLLLYAMNPKELVVLEEVVKYANMVHFLKTSFGLENMWVYANSLYDFDSRQDDHFDLINFSGVLYHVTDPILALKILVDKLKIGGMLCCETAVTYAPWVRSVDGQVDRRPILEYVGPSKNQKFGWNWFFPSWTFLEQVTSDLGMEFIATKGDVRAKFIAVKKEHKPLMQCGVSKRV